jgi:TonB family protein
VRGPGRVVSSAMRSIRIPFLAALAAAVAIHAALLVGHGPSGTSGAVQSPRSLLLVRMLEARPDRLGEPSRDGPLSAAPRSPDASLERSDLSLRNEPRAAPAQIGAETRPVGDNRSSESAASAAAAGAQRAGLTRPEEGLPPAPGYLLGAQLDARPFPLYDIEPAFPPEADLQEGVVTLRILIGATGNVDNVAVVSASPPGLFERSALAAFESAKFSPGMTLGVAVKSQMTVEVNFTPFNRGAKASGRGY